MKIFKWIIKYFKKLTSLFGKNKEVAEIGSTTQENAADPISEKEIETSAKAQPATEIPETTNVEPKPKVSKLQKKVNALDKKLAEIQKKQGQIEQIYPLKNYPTDKDIEELERIYQKYNNKENVTFSTSAIDKLKSRFGQFDKFLQERVLVVIYQKREAEKVKEFKKFKQEIASLHVQVDKQIKQSDFQSAKLTLRKLEVLLKSIQALSVKIIQGKAKENNRVVSNLISKTVELKRELSFKETEIEAKRQAEELKKEAERRYLAEEARRKEERQRREQVALIQRQQEEAKRREEEEKKQQLQSLCSRKSNWQEYADVLQANGVTTFYHFTDKANIASIKKNGGLFSWQYCDRNGISIPVAGGDTLSRNLDIGQGLQDFVRLSFISDHPMMHVALRDRRIFQSVVLEISLEVAYFANTKFSNMNAADNRHQNDTSVNFLKNLRFDLFKQSYFNLEGADKKYFQSEVMVKTWVPIKYITNINQF